MRLATRSDAIRLSALATQVFLHTYATEGVTDDLSSYALSAFSPSSFERTISDSSSAILIEEAGDGVVAFLEVSFDTPCPANPELRTEVTRLYVQEHFSRRGIGTRLLDECRRLTGDRVGNPALWLSVFAGNNKAFEFYTSCGFRRAGELWFELESVAHLNFVLVDG